VLYQYSLFDDNSLYDERKDDIYDVEQFRVDVLKGVTVKRLAKIYNVTSSKVVEKKRDLGLLDIRYSNRMRQVKKSV
jgi:hypothetical protein